MKKKIICSITYLIGFIIFVAGLGLLNSKFGTEAWLYGIIASFGVLVYTMSSMIKNNWE